MYSVNPNCYPSPPDFAQKGIPASFVEAISAAEDEYGCSAADVRYFEQTTEVPEEQPHSPQALGN